MDLQQLEYFITIAKYKNFTTAAKEFYITQPCISHQIKALEDELGVDLFIRNTRSVELTDEGSIFLQDAIKVVDILKHSKYKLQQNRENLMKLSIGNLAAPTKYFLPIVVHEFKKKHPNIKVQLHRKDASGLYHDAQNGIHDIYFSMYHDLTSIDDIDKKIILNDYYCLVTPNDHPITQNTPLDSNLLVNESFIFMDPSRATTIYKQALEICKHIGFQPHIVSTYPLYEDILFAIEAGIGISILPYRSKEYMNNDNLTYTLLDQTNIKIALAIAWHKNSDNPAVNLFLDVFNEYLNNHPDLFNA